MSTKRKGMLSAITWVRVYSNLYNAEYDNRKIGILRILETPVLENGKIFILKRSYNLVPLTPMGQALPEGGLLLKEKQSRGHNFEAKNLDVAKFKSNIILCQAFGILDKEKEKIYE